MIKRYSGVFTPLVTPVKDDESLDLESLRSLVRFQIVNGVHGLWTMGTSAEFASFSPIERRASIEAVADEAAGRVPVIANVSDAATRLAIEHARHAKQAGADALAATPPYYYPHGQDELLSHYRAIRLASDLPLFIYNIPQTVRVRVDLRTAQVLASEGTVAGIKDSQNDLEWFRQLAVYIQDAKLDFALFAGTRHLIDASVLVGADGVIPSIANAFPELTVSIFERARAGEFAAAADLQRRVVAIENIAAARVPGSRNAATLGMIKAVLWKRGIITSPRLTNPLLTYTAEEVEAVLSAVGPHLEATAAT